MSRQFRQIELSDKALEAGLDSPLNWNSPGEYFAEIAAEPYALKRQLGIQFQYSFDQLDYLQVARLELASGKQITLIRHRGKRQNGILVSAGVADLATGDDLVAELVEALELDPVDITWRAPLFVEPPPRPQP